MRRRFALAPLAAVALAACQPSDSVTPVETPDVDIATSAPRLVATAGLGTDAQPIPGQYIVLLKPGTSATAVAGNMASITGAPATAVYTTAVNGFAMNMSATQAATLANNPAVASIEPDQIVTASATTQTSAPWGVDRLDQRNLPLSGTFKWEAGGKNVWMYVIDTGIRTDHQQFGGRATLGFNNAAGLAPTGDCNGHGTHVAGTIGGTTYGVAKLVRLIGVRVLDCNGSGTTSGVIAGVDWVTQQKLANPSRLMVANMSLGGGISTALDAAVNNAVARGVTVVVAAGNSNADACNSSPARAANAITVGATNSTDVRASFSNFGSCVDLFAPGVSITSAWNTSSTAAATANGTSMASPHVAGIVAQYLMWNGAATPTVVTNTLLGAATLNKVVSPGTGSPNRLAFTQW